MGRVTPYSPMHEPRKEVTTEQMFATLARHAAPKQVSIETVTQTPKAELPRLEWAKPEKYYCRTSCGRYSIAKAFVYGKAGYQVWKLVPGSSWFAMVYRPVDSFGEAQAIAQADSSK